MRVIAVPVKSLEQAKGRLAPLLSPPERARLSLVMLQGVLKACLHQPGWDVWVVSRDPAVLRTAATAGVRPLPEEGTRLLSAIRQVESRLEPGGDELAVVLADLPLISAKAVSAALGLGGPGVVAVPSASDGGTNLLLRRPPSVIPSRFGRSSFARHRFEAHRRGVTFTEAGIDELGFDLDRPEDVLALLGRTGPNPTRQACIDMGVAGRLRVLA